MRARGQVVTWQCSHVIQVKVIFVVMKQLKQLQRKPRKIINGIRMIYNLAVKPLWKQVKSDFNFIPVI